MRELKIGDYVEYYDWVQIGKVHKAVYLGIKPSNKSMEPLYIKVKDIGSKYIKVIFAGQLVNLNVVIPEMEDNNERNRVHKN